MFPPPSQGGAALHVFGHVPPEADLQSLPKGHRLRKEARNRRNPGEDDSATPEVCRPAGTDNKRVTEMRTFISLKHLLPFSEYKIHTFDEIETILLENGLK